MCCFSEDCDFVEQHGDCFYDGVPPSNSPKTCEVCGFFKAKTHYDRIRAKSAEEMAEMMAVLGGCPLNVMTNCPKGHAPNGDCNAKRCWLDWLKQEVSTDG